MALTLGSKRRSSISDSNSEWATSLPLLVGFLILDNLLEVIDHVCFAAVCNAWHSLAKSYNQTTQRFKHMVLPMLLIPPEYFPYSISEGKFYNNNIPLLVPRGKRCCGSSHGWLATVDLEDDQRPTIVITLRNPFRKAAVDPIRLPSLDVPVPIEKRESHLKHYEYFVSKVILSIDPSLNPNENYVVAVLYGTNDLKLAFIKRGQTHWTCINNQRISRLTDIIFHKESQIYAVGAWGDIMLLDLKHEPLQVNIHMNVDRLQVKRPFPLTFLMTPAVWGYLLESTKEEVDILHVRRIIYYKSNWNKRTGTPRKWELVDQIFKVYKLVYRDEGSVVRLRQVEVKNIGDEALFLGDNHSVSVLSSNFPECLQPNSIYYRDLVTFLDREDLFGRYKRFADGLNVGIFNLESGTSSTHQYDSLKS